jgi:hypothetical protein
MFADSVLLVQCLYYRRAARISAKLALAEAVEDDDDEDGSTLATPRSPLLGNDADRRRRRLSTSSSCHRLPAGDFTPVTPLLGHAGAKGGRRLSSASASAQQQQQQPLPPSPPLPPPASALQTALLNTLAMVLVCAAGVFGWWLTAMRSGGGGGSDYGAPGNDSGVYSYDGDNSDDAGNSGPLRFSVLGQVFGYLSAALYLGSRLPQIWLNWRRKSTEGVSLLFFLFACLGNLTYVLSIAAFEPPCVRYSHAGGSVGSGSIGSGGSGGGSHNYLYLHLRHHHQHNHQYRPCRPGEALASYGHYMLVNASWLLGSFGTVLLDLIIFAQFFMYNAAVPASSSSSSTA